MAHLDTIAVGQDGGLLDAPLIDERALLAAEVLEEVAGAPARDAGVGAGHERIREQEAAAVE